MGTRRPTSTQILLGFQFAVVLAEVLAYIASNGHHQLALVTRFVLSAQGISAVSIVSTFALLATRRWDLARLGHLLYLPYLFFALLPCLFLVPYNLAKFLAALFGYFLVRAEARNIRSAQGHLIT